MSPTMSPTELRALAPDAFEAFERVIATAAGAVDPTRLVLARARIAGLLGIDLAVGSQPAEAGDRLMDLASWPTSPRYDEIDRACLAVVEQFILDVSAMTDEHRRSLTDALGEQAATFVQALYTIDYELRAGAAFEQLFGADPLRPTSARDGVGGELWPALETMMSAIARLDGLDPMTTELVRLRGARVHNCRICKSLRNVRAVQGGADEVVFDQVDLYETSDLADAHKVALRLADAIYWSPAAFPPALVEQVHDHYRPEQVVELVLDVTRNALNKFAVAMGVDGEGVGDDIAYYDIAPSGELVYGLTPQP